MIRAGRRAFVVGTLAAAACGRQHDQRVAASGSAQRIASQTILSDEILWALGDPVRARVVAVSALVDDARYSTIVGTWPAKVPRTPGTSEALLALAPDLAIVADFTAAETRALLEHAGVALVRLSGFDGFADYRRHVAELAGAVGAPEAGAELVRSFDARLSELRVVAPSRRPGIVSFTEGNVAGAGTTFADVARAAGFANIAATAGIEGHRQVTIDQIVAWDPEVLVVPCGPDEADADAIVTDTATRPGLAATRAARRGHIVPIPSALLYSAGAPMLDVVQRLAARHPEAG